MDPSITNGRVLTAHHNRNHKGTSRLRLPFLCQNQMWQTYDCKNESSNADKANSFFENSTAWQFLIFLGYSPYILGACGNSKKACLEYWTFY